MKKIVTVTLCLLLLSACGEDTKITKPTEKEPVGKGEPAAPLIKETTVPTKKETVVTKFNWDWDAPTKPYYTLGRDPMDSAGLYQRFNLDEKNTDYIIMQIPSSTFLYTPKEASFIFYSHLQLEDSGETATKEQIALLSIPSIFEENKATNCRALTDGMVDAFDESKLTLTLAYLNKTSDGASIQTWVFNDKEDNFFYFSQRDINKPKGYAYRCQKDVIEQLKEGLFLAPTLKM